MKPTTPQYARELASNLEAATLMGSSRAADYLRSLADQLDAALQDRVALAMQVEAMTQNLDGHKTQASEDFALINSLTAERNQAIEAGHAAVEMCGKLINERDVLTKERDSLRAELEIANSILRANMHNSAHPDTKELAELRADAERYRWLDANGLFAQPQGYDTQIGIASPNEPVGILYVSNCSTHIASKAIDAAKAASQPPAVICGNCDTALPKGCGGQFLDDGEHCRFGKAAS